MNNLQIIQLETALRFALLILICLVRLISKHVLMFVMKHLIYGPIIILEPVSANAQQVLLLTISHRDVWKFVLFLNSTMVILPLENVFFVVPNILNCLLITKLNNVFIYALIKHMVLPYREYVRSPWIALLTILEILSLNCVSSNVPQRNSPMQITIQNDAINSALIQLSLITPHIPV